jgi:hypothetical protein
MARGQRHDRHSQIPPIVRSLALPLPILRIVVFVAYRMGIVVTLIKNYNFIVDLAGGDLELSHRDYNFS